MNIRSTEALSATETYLVGANVNLPRQADKWGCTTAVAAFMARSALGLEVLPSQIDNDIGREPNKAIMRPFIAKWLLDRGLTVDSYNPPKHSLHQAREDYAHSRLSLTGFIEKYEQVFGALHEENRGVFEDYYENTVKPFILQKDQFFKPYKLSGRIRMHEDIVFEPSLIEQILSGGSLTYAQVTNNVESSSHAVCLFSPGEGQIPPCIFNPGVEQSRVELLEQDLIDKVFCGDSSIDVWHKP